MSDDADGSDDGEDESSVCDDATHAYQAALEQGKRAQAVAEEGQFAEGFWEP